MKDLISIIIPCYNAAKTISRTLNSIREQDFKDVEVIVVNDGSTDNSLQVLSMFEKVDNRIKIITQENSGVSVARNNGIKHAKGNYIVYLDADDNYTTPYALSNMMKRLKETNSDMVVCKFTHPCFEQYLEEGEDALVNKRKPGNSIAKYHKKKRLTPIEQLEYKIILLERELLKRNGEITRLKKSIELEGGDVKRK